MAASQCRKLRSGKLYTPILLKSRSQRPSSEDRRVTKAPNAPFRRARIRKISKELLEHEKRLYLRISEAPYSLEYGASCVAHCLNATLDGNNLSGKTHKVTVASTIETSSRYNPPEAIAIEPGELSTATARTDRAPNDRADVVSWPPRPTGWSSLPYPKGMPNRLADCYRRTALQMMFHLPEFQRRLRELMGNATHLFHHSKDSCLLCIVSRLSRAVWGGDDNLVEETNRFDSQVKEQSGFFAQGWMTAEGEHCDTVEPLEWLIELLEYDYPSKNPFQCVLTATLACEVCSRPLEEQQIETRPILPLSIDDRVCQSDRLEDLLSVKLHQGVRKTCPSCNIRQDHKGRWTLSQVPEVLLIQLCRSDGLSKNSRKILYPENLDISFHAESAEEKVLYRLSSVICHQGSGMQFGHYTIHAYGPNGHVAYVDDNTSYPSTIEIMLNPHLNAFSKQQDDASVLAYERIYP